jgi:hypothetical protein
MLRTTFRIATLIAAALLAACGGETATGSAATIALSDSAVAALPALIIEDATRICRADGRTYCPYDNAYANRLEDGSITLWRAGGLVGRFTAEDTTLQAVGRIAREGRPGYRSVIGVGSARNGTWMFESLPTGFRALRFNRQGEVTDSAAPTLPTGTTSLGFIGSQPVMQVIRGMGDSFPARLHLVALKSPKDSTGETILDTPIPWMRVTFETIRVVPPLFAASPVFAFDAKLGLLWSPGDTGRVERRDRKGRTLWEVTGLTGIPVDSADFVARRRELEAAFNIPMSEDEFAAMAAKAMTMHPSVSGLLLAPDGRALVARSMVPSRDSLEWLRLAADGSPLGRFTLPKHVRVLLDAGDSLLVHRQTEGELTEVRWLRLGLPAPVPAN